MNDRKPKRIRSSTTSCSDLDLDKSNIDTNSSGDTDHPSSSAQVENSIKRGKKLLKQKAKKQRKEKNTTMESTINEKLDKINDKLQNILTKDDRDFIRNIIKETIEEMKENLLASVNRKIETVEFDVHNQAKEIESMRAEITSNKKECEDHEERTDEKIGTRTEKLRAEINRLKTSANVAEQYSRRNNIRVVGIKNDTNKQSADETTQIVTTALNAIMGLNITSNDIDIAHRLGTFTENKNRPVIVKFVRRQTKVDIFSRTKRLTGKKIFINEDLTMLNHQVLMSLRLKDPSRIERAWSFEGKLFATFKPTNPQDPQNYNRQVKFNEYDDWLDRPRPARKST